MSRSAGNGSAVRAPEEQLNLVLDRLDAQDPDVATARSAGDRPCVYRRRNVLFELAASAGLMQSARVMTRVLDRQLVKFLHGGFVHTGQRGRLHLPRDPSLDYVVDGVIAACRHITGRIHECSLKLDEPVELAMFVPEATPRAALVIDDEPTTRAFVERCLARLNIDVTTAHGGAAGLAALKQAAFDIVLLDLDMPEMDGFATLKALREQGFAGCVAAITALTDADISTRSLDAGFDLFVPKPLAPDLLSELVRTAVRKQPLFSRHCRNAALAPLIDAFVDSLVEKTQLLRAALHGKDYAGLSRLARALKSDAVSYGFDLVATNATQLDALLRATPDVVTLHRQVCELAALCGQAQRAGSSQCGKLAPPSAPRACAI